MELPSIFCITGLRNTYYVMYEVFQERKLEAFGSLKEKRQKGFLVDIERGHLTRQVAKLVCKSMVRV